VRRFGRWGRNALLALAALLAVIAVLRAAQVSGGPELAPWHLVAPPDPDVAALDRMDWPAWLAAEQRAFAAVAAEVTARLAPEHRVPANRFFEGSPLHPARFAQDWNRSFVLEPNGPPAGAAVFLHGLTDAPYSLRHLAEAYRARGFVAIGMRMPGHGTVPAGLTRATAAEWAAATRLAMREAARRAAGGPVHLVGYSNGGALAMRHALDALENPSLPRAERIVLVSPMIGVTAFARFAGLAALPAFLPRFAAAAWLDVLPEFNPFKYNSFPANAARQSWLLSSALQADLRRLAAAGRLAALPPVLTFQSVADATVSAPAVLDALYAVLPPGGHEIVLFDINHRARLGPLLRADAFTLAERLLPPGPRSYAATLVTNAAPDSDQAVARRSEAGTQAVTERALGLAWPRSLHSLSHLALGFPVTDGLYGLEPDPADAFGVELGAVAPRGERGLLVTSLDSLLRVTSNPFFPYLLERVVAPLPPPR
jgi:alpha-beta hydrolase superfamily lysophospholipase